MRTFRRCRYMAEDPTTLYSPDQSWSILIITSLMSGLFEKKQYLVRSIVTITGRQMLSNGVFMTFWVRVPGKDSLTAEDDIEQTRPLQV